MSNKYKCISRAIEKRLLIIKYRNKFSRLVLNNTNTISNKKELSAFYFCQSLYLCSFLCTLFHLFTIQSRGF